jgi:hypothetical protein
LVSDRFDRFLPIAGVLAGLLVFVGLILLWDDPSSETGPAETFAYWQDDRGQHQIVALLVAPLIAFLLLFVGAGLRRRLARGNGDAGHGSVAFGGALLGATTFALVGMLEAAMTTRTTDAAPSARASFDGGARQPAPSAPPSHDQLLGAILRERLADCGARF